MQRSTRSPSYMANYVAFTRSFVPHHSRNGARVRVQSKPSPNPYGVTRSQIRMIQSPHREGPPQLDDFFDLSKKTEGVVGAPVTIGTGRALLANNDDDAAKTCVAALSTALQALRTEPQLVHCTFSLDVDAGIVARTLQKEVEAPILGRSVNKKDSSGNVEVLVLSSEEETGISFASATVPDGNDAQAAARTSAVTAANRALDGLVSRRACTFKLFCHTPGHHEEIRAGLDEALPGTFAYGGPAVGEEVSGDCWALLGGDSLLTGGTQKSKTVHVAAVPGSLSFLHSAVIKNWAQPAFTEALSLMKPHYVGDPQRDLLTAIRYNDWEKFLWCLEEEGVDVNTKWTGKQNQSPLLAACARARTEMIKYLIDHGADVGHRNDSGYTASMYTRKLVEYDRALILNQLKMLRDAGVEMQLTEQERNQLLRSGSGKFVE